MYLLAACLLAGLAGPARSAGLATPGVTPSGLEGVLARCCALGGDWARQRSYASCADFPPPVSSVPGEQLAVCIAAADICCRRDNRNIQCRRGTNAALADRKCSANATEYGEAYKDCCEACKLGMIAGSLGEAAGAGCSLKRFAFGLPWDEAFHQCCSDSLPSSPNPSPTVGAANDLLAGMEGNQSLCDALSRELCSHVCVPTPGSFRCECHPGFALMADGKSCQLQVEEDRCLKNNPCMHRCQDTGLAVECSCHPGYALQPDRKSCKDIDECALGSHLCPSAQTCRNDPGGYTCLGKDGAPIPPPFDAPLDNALPLGPIGLASGSADRASCPAGYRLNTRAGVCDDVDECAEAEAAGSAACPRAQDCVNTVGSFFCGGSGSGACPPNYSWDPVAERCADKDECEDGSHECDADTEFCLNSEGGYTCLARIQGRGSCPAGYKKDATQRSGCRDVDECADAKLHICNNATELCINEPGGYRCVKRDAPAPLAARGPTGPTLTASPGTPTTSARCGPGYVFSFHSGKCVDEDECVRSPCDSTQRCVNSVGSYTCECRDGFTRDSTTLACVDVNECQLGTAACLHTQRCDNTIGSYQCIRHSGCGTGYTLNAATGSCEDDDECALGTDNCRESGPQWVCRNTQGSFRCERRHCDGGSVLLDSGECRRVECDPGFQPAPGTADCVDIDECKLGPVCGSYKRCVNTPGSFHCVFNIQCKPGFAPNPAGDRCVDVDECATGTHECKPGQNCLNRPGHYQCQCPAGHALDADKNCVDVDECARFPQQACSNLAKCENTVGSYRCICNEGFKAGRGKSCDDIDECAETPGLCQQQCHNVWGSYRCSCERGFHLHSDNRSCIDVDECQVHKDRRLCVGDCLNTPGSYKCTCPAGYKLGKDGRACIDIDECATGRECRRPGEVCQNMQGSFRCNSVRCPEGYQQDPTQRNRCRRASRACAQDDVDCRRQPLLMTFNFMSLVSNMTIPPTGQLDLFVMKGAPASDTYTSFTLELDGARAPEGVPAANRTHFRLTQVRGNQAVVSLTRPLLGPQDVELRLVMEVFSGTYFAGLNVAKLFLFVSQYEF